MRRLQVPSIDLKHPVPRQQPPRKPPPCYIRNAYTLPNGKVVPGKLICRKK